MRPMMGLIGANGVGKTSFMDALSLLAASARGSLNQHLNEMGGIFSVLTRNHSAGIDLMAEVNYPKEEALKYILQVAPRFPGYYISQEYLAQERSGIFQYIRSENGVVQHCGSDGRLVKAESAHNDQESALSQVPRVFLQMAHIWRTLSTATQYHVLNVSRMAPIKVPQQLRPAALPGRDGEDLAPFLYSLRETSHERFVAVEDALRAAFPGFESLSFPVVAAGMIAMTWKDKSFRNPFHMSELSEGTLRFLWLASLLQSPSLSTITMIDEPEVSLHPELLALLADLMREASNRTQIIVATHSDRLVRFLEPKEIMVMDIEEDGASSMSWADSLDIEAWLAEYSLDEAWQMGVIGGRA
jgi:predicted ATPase